MGKLQLDRQVEMPPAIPLLYSWCLGSPSQDRATGLKRAAQCLLAPQHWRKDHCIPIVMFLPSEEWFTFASSHAESVRFNLSFLSPTHVPSPPLRPPCSAPVSRSRCSCQQQSRTLDVPVPNNMCGAKCCSDFAADPTVCLGRSGLLGTVSALGPRQATSVWVGSERQRRNLEDSRAAANGYHSVPLLSASASGFWRKAVLVMLVSAGKTFR